MRTDENRESLMPPEGATQQLLVTHKHGRQLLDCSNTHYWALVRKRKITIAGRGRAGRAYLPSILAYVDELLAEAQRSKEAVSYGSKSKTATQT
jgi:hypothetical protein